MIICYTILFFWDTWYMNKYIKMHGSNYHQISSINRFLQQNRLIWSNADIRNFLICKHISANLKRSLEAWSNLELNCCFNLVLFLGIFLFIEFFLKWFWNLIVKGNIVHCFVWYFFPRFNFFSDMTNFSHNSIIARVRV